MRRGWNCQSLKVVKVNELALFAGAGGGLLGSKLIGWHTVCAVEIDPYCAGVLVARQNDGHLEPFPIWDDVRTFDGRPWRGSVDVVSGGFPCQDISSAGRGAGIRGANSGLWSEMARIVREVEPRHVFVENVAILTRRGLDVVLGDLAAMGFDARWGVLGACQTGAPHKRDRLWIVATDSNSKVKPACAVDDEVALEQEPVALERDIDWWANEPKLGRVADGVAHRVDRLRAIGNGQVPAVAALAWCVLGGEHAQ